MSRPPRPHAGKSTTGVREIGRGAMDYLPSEFADFVERERAISASELGLVSSGQEGDFAVTLMELPALVTHVLAFYQDRYASEAFLGTAQSPRSLVRHGRRLGYEPDPGLSAMGYLVLTVRPGLAGKILKGFAVASAPFGEKKAQDYETLDDTGVHHLHNELKLRDSLVDGKPSQEPVAGTLRIDESIEGVEPGQLLALSASNDPTVPTEIARIAAVGSEAAGPLITFRVIDPPAGGRNWTRGEIQVRGNVARISHGKTIEEILGDSDGVTPFLRFTLKNKPLTHLPAPSGATAALEVRIGGMLWSRVDDFYESEPFDRHYIVQRGVAGSTDIIFGDGRRGAIPRAGKRHITTRYRVGLGRDGNAEAGRVDRIRKAHPLLEHAQNPVPVGGGADPASPEDVRTQATRFIRTFDRAVSVQDHADVALLFPGVARASARYVPLSEGGPMGICVVVADAMGGEPAAIQQIKKFLQVRRDNTVPLQVIKPESPDIQIKVQVEIDGSLLPEVVERAIRDALYGEQAGAAGIFSFAGRNLGQPAFLSEVYAAIAGTAGVSFVEVIVFDFEPTSANRPRVLEVLRAAPNEWLRLLPEHCQVRVLEVQP